MARPRLGANTAPTTIAFGDAASAGTAGANAALADHRHGMPSDSQYLLVNGSRDVLGVLDINPDGITFTPDPLPHLNIVKHSNTDAASIGGYRARASAAMAVDGDDIIRLDGFLWDGDQWITAARVLLEAAATVANDVVSSRIKFQTANGAATSSDRWRIEAAGDFIPAVNNTHDVGSTSLRVRGIYVGDADISGALKLSGAQSHTLTANDELITLAAGTTVLDISGANFSIGGIAGGSVGRTLIVRTGASGISMLYESATQTAANRIQAPGLVDLDLANRSLYVLTYISGNRWAVGGIQWAATPSTQAFGDAAAAGTLEQIARGDHKHAMMADPHSGYAKSIQPASAVAINSVTDVNLFAQAVAGLAVGDSLIVDAYIVLINNSGAAATYVFTLDIGAAFDIEFTTLSIAAAAGVGWAIHLNGVLGIVSTAMARTVTKMDMAVASGASGADATLAATQLEAMRWAESATNLTGSQTVTLKARSSTATATQTAHLVAATLQKASL